MAFGRTLSRIQLISYAMPAAASSLSLYGIKAWNAMVNQAKPS